MRLEAKFESEAKNDRYKEEEEFKNKWIIFVDLIEIN